MGKRLLLSYNFALKKEDYISQLPDDILVHILSFLSIKEAADTSVLSKRWLPLWKYIPRLDFDATKQLAKIALCHKLHKKLMKKFARFLSSSCTIVFEEMVVRGSGTLVNFEVVGPSLKLKHLEIWYCFDLKSLQIYDTNFVTLRTSAGDKLLLRNFPMLMEVDISGIPFTHMLDGILPWVSSVLSQLEVLKIHANKGLEYLEHYKLPKLAKLKKFVVNVDAWKNTSLLGCTHVIGAAPHLKEFELTLFWFKPKRSKRESKKAVRCLHHHLKVLRLCGYYGRTSELELVRYFLENAIALEKIIVDPRIQYLSRLPLSLEEIEKEQMARTFAKVQLESKVPPHIELVIL